MVKKLLKILAFSSILMVSLFSCTFAIGPVTSEACIFQDGFEDGVAHWDGKVGSGTLEISSDDPYSGTRHLNSSVYRNYAWLHKTFAPQTTIYVHQAVKIHTPPPIWSYLCFMQLDGSLGDHLSSAWLHNFAGTWKWAMYALESGSLKLYNSQPFSFNSSKYYSVQLKAVIGENGGFTLYVDGVEVIAVSGVDSDNKGEVVRVKVGARTVKGANMGVYNDCVVVSNTYVVNPEPAGFRIGLVSDVHHWTCGNYGTMRNSYALTWLQDFIVAMSDMDLVVGLGDWINANTSTNDAEAEAWLRDVYGVWNTLATPHKATFGNHDFRALNQSQVLNIWSDQTFNCSFDVGNYHFIVVDSAYRIDGQHADAEYIVGGFVPQEELDWIANDLASTNKPTVVFIHQGVANISQEGNLYFQSYTSGATVSNKDAVHKVFSSSGKVIAVFSGHQHWNRMLIQDGIPYFQIGSLVDTAMTELGEETWAEAVVNNSSVTLRIYEQNGTLAKTFTANFNFDPSRNSADSKTYFSITSNSTILEVTFVSKLKILNFTVTGPSGTKGYAEVLVCKTIMENASDLIVYLDGAKTNCTVKSDGDFWLIYFEYNHSSHQVSMIFSAQAPQPNSTQIIVVELMTILVCTAIVWHRVAVKRLSRRRRMLG